MPSRLALPTVALLPKKIQEPKPPISMFLGLDEKILRSFACCLELSSFCLQSGPQLVQLWSKVGKLLLKALGLAFKPLCPIPNRCEVTTSDQLLQLGHFSFNGACPVFQSFHGGRLNVSEQLPESLCLFRLVDSYHFWHDLAEDFHLPSHIVEGSSILPAHQIIDAILHPCRLAVQMSLKLGRVRLTEWLTVHWSEDLDLRKSHAHAVAGAAKNVLTRPSPISCGNSWIS